MSSKIVNLSVLCEEGDLFDSVKLTDFFQNYNLQLFIAILYCINTINRKLYWKL